METFEYSKAKRKELQSQKTYRVMRVIGAGIAGGLFGYVVGGEYSAAVLAPLCGLVAHYSID